MASSTSLRPRRSVAPTSQTQGSDLQSSSMAVFGMVARDSQHVADLEAAGWRVRRVWEHEVFEDLARCVGRIVEKGEPISWRVFFVQPVDADGAIERRYMCELRGCEEERVIEQRRHTRK